MTETTRAQALPAQERQREGRTILRLALPLTAAYLAEMGMVITDMIIVGRLGSNELAAVGLAGDLFWIFLLIGMGVISIVGVFAAQSLGAGDRQATVAACEQGMIAATITALPVMACVWFLEALLAAANQDRAVVELAGSYSRVLAFAVFPALWFVVLRNYVTALARSAAIGWIMAVALLLNLALNYTLVYGHLGLPALGVVGAGIGTTVVNWLMFAALVQYVRRARHLAAYRPTIIPRRIDGRLLHDMFGLGVPVALTQVLNGGMYSAAAVLTGIIGASTLAAQQILYGVVYLAFSAAGGFGDAVRVRVAYGVGRGDVAAARRSARVALALAATSALLVSLVLWLRPQWLVGIFLGTTDVENREVLAIALSLSAVAALFMLLDGTQYVLANSLRGLRDTRSPLWISLTGYWGLGLGSGVLLCFPLGYGAHGLWWGLVAGVILCNLLLALRLRQRFAHIGALADGAAVAPAQGSMHHADGDRRD